MCIFVVFNVIGRTSHRLDFEDFAYIHNMMFCNVAGELPCRYPLFKKLVKLLQTSAFGLWNEEKDPDCQNQVAATPDIAVPGSPVQSSWVEEIWRAERAKPPEDEVESVGNTNGL